MVNRAGLNESQGQPRVLVTGIAGFCGSHLAEFLLEQRLQVVGIDRQGANLDNLGKILGHIDLRQVNLQNVSQVRRVLTDVRPNWIYHLAALTKPQPDDDYWALYEVNVQGTINLLETIRAERLECSVLITGSSAQYGLVQPNENPIRETHPFHPITHYAVSKATQDLMGYQYWAANNLRVICTRTFNIIGPRQSPHFVGSAFARQIAGIEQGLREPIIEVGNLEAQRDFVDVRDVIRAYWLVLERGKPGQAYNVCAGRSHSIRSLLQELVALSTVGGIEIRQDPARMQASDVPIQIGNYDRLRQHTGWEPQITFKQTLLDLLNYWREQLSKETLL